MFIQNITIYLHRNTSEPIQNIRLCFDLLCDVISNLNLGYGKKREEKQNENEKSYVLRDQLTYDNSKVKLRSIFLLLLITFSGK